jgi:soluble lytic murein transglycosylase-like protein
MRITSLWNNRWINRAFLALMVCFILLPFTASADWWTNSSPPVARNRDPMPAAWWEKIKTLSEQHHINPFLVAAVADMEGNGWVQGRIGRSRYHGPMGVNEENGDAEEWKLKDPLANIELGMSYIWKRAARGMSDSEIMKKYNTEWYKNNYLREVLRLADRMENDARDEIIYSRKTVNATSYQKAIR